LLQKYEFKYVSLNLILSSICCTCSSIC